MPLLETDLKQASTSNKTRRGETSVALSRIPSRNNLPLATEKKLEVAGLGGSASH